MQFIKNVKQHKPSFNGSIKHYNWYICGKEVCDNPTQFNLSQRLGLDYRTLVTLIKVVITGENGFCMLYLSGSYSTTQQKETQQWKDNNEYYSRRSNRQRGMFTNTRDTPMKKKTPINTRDQTDNVNEYCKKNKTQRDTTMKKLEKTDDVDEKR